MWDRKELKEKGKAAFKANYWKCVLVGLLLVLFAAGTGASTSMLTKIQTLFSTSARTRN